MLNLCSIFYFIEYKHVISAKLLNNVNIVQIIPNSAKEDYNNKYN